MAKYRSIDLFAGIGGIRLGFDNAFGKDIERIADTVHMSDSVIRRITLSTVIIAAFKALQIVFCFAGLLPVLASVIIDTFANILVSVYMLYLKK